MGLLDDVRTHAADLMRSPTHVRVNQAGIAAYAQSLPLEKLRNPELDPATHFVSDRDGTLAYLVSLDAINFGSGYFPHLRKRPGLSGYFTVAASWKDLFETRGPLSPEELRALTADDCARIFGQVEADADAQELMGLFAQALNDLGEFIAERFDGCFRALVESADGSAEALAELLTQMAFFRDVGFYKRAQLTAADLSLAGVAAFRDLDRLTIFADNLVPHVLRLDGLLDYEPRLAERIEREELVAAGSLQEQEIRAGALHVVELLADALGRRVSPMQLDYLLWNRGQEPAYKARPRHRTRTVYY